MSYVDERGRLFGRINLVDASVAAVILLLIPLAYATFLLFKPAAPRITGVAPSSISKEEQRISAGGKLVAKFKIKGEGFTPLLRARIGDTDALGLVFETPNSADVLVGPVSPGAHDLVLLDGVQEVARARGAITIQESNTTSIRVVGWLTDLDDELVKTIQVGTALPEGSPAYRILALGPLVPGYRRISLAGSSVELPMPGTHARAAVVAVVCDAMLGDNPCTAGERFENRSAPVIISLPGGGRLFNLAIDELLPPTPPTKATLRVRQSAVSPTMVRTGDRDSLLDERAAIVTAVTGDTITLDAGIDRDHDGWRYRGQRLRPGARFVFNTDRYEVSGVVVSIEIAVAKP